jgi:hypothetical protein
MRWRRRLTESYCFSGDYELELESVLEECDFRLDSCSYLGAVLLVDGRVDRWAWPRVGRPVGHLTVRLVGLQTVNWFAGWI